MNTINILEKKKLTYIIIFIFVVFALIHLYKINKQTNEGFATQNITDNVSVNSSSVYVDIPSLSQVRFGDIKNGSLNTGLDVYLASKANAIDLASKANAITVTNLEAIINGTTGLNTKAEKSALDIVKTTADNAMPELSIIAYAGGNNLPAGWQLCDGNVLFYTNGDSVSNLDKFVNLKKSLGMVLTPDLRGRFILGSNPEKVNGATTNFDRNIRLVNETGGEEKHTLTMEEMPKHTHTHKDRIHVEPHAKGNEHDYAYQRLGFELLDYTANPGTWSNGDWQHWPVAGAKKIWGKNDITGDTGGRTTDGTTKEHENMPPFYVLTYIIKKPIKTPTTTV